MPSKEESVLVFGPVVPDGYGLCYNPQETQIIFGVSAFNNSPETDSIKMGNSVRQSLIDMRDLMAGSLQAKLWFLTNLLFQQNFVKTLLFVKLCQCWSSIKIIILFQSNKKGNYYIINYTEVHDLKKSNKHWVHWKLAPTNFCFFHKSIYVIFYISNFQAIQVNTKMNLWMGKSKAYQSQCLCDIVLYIF